MPSTAGATASSKLVGALVKASDWLKTRFNNIDIFDEHFANEAKTNPFYALGGIFYLIWFIVMFTGLVLIMWYIPTKSSAFDSILNIQHHIPFGNIMRGMHKYGADAMIIAATMRLYRMFLSADYKPGREFNIAIALITLLLSMYSGLTGYLLIWNQRAFWATKVFATFPTYMDQFPFWGDFYLPLVKSLHMGWNTAEFLLGAGGAITQETITRFFSLHLAFSLIPLIAVELYFYKTGYKRIPINWLKRSVIIAMLLVVSVIMPAALGHRSNPDVTPLPILSDWYFLGLYQMYKYLEPVVATEITMIIPILVVLLPFIDNWVTGPEKSLSKRPLMFMITVMGFVNWAAFSGLIIANVANIHSDPPYWRDFLYLMINAGMLLQLLVYWRDRNIAQRARYAFGALVMGIFCLVQSLVALTYYYMARTEMFLSPVTQAFTYWLCRPFMGDNAARAEAAVRQLCALKSNPPYWFYQDLLQKTGDLPGRRELEALNSVAGSSTDFDRLFQAIPTFLPGEQYKGLIDFMVSNRWCFDYITFCDRMNGLVKPYPVDVPPLDWGWMAAAPVCAAACFFTWLKFKSQGTQKLTQKPTAEPEPAATAF